MKEEKENGIKKRKTWRLKKIKSLTVVEEER
jgi:hypothetical protein